MNAPATRLNTNNQSTNDYKRNVGHTPAASFNTSTFCQVNNYCFLVPVAVMQLVVSFNLELQALKKRWVSKVQYVCELQ